MDKRDLLALLRAHGTVKATGGVNPAVGIVDGYYELSTDLGPALVRAAVVDALRTQMPDDVTCVAGTGHAGTVLATALAGDDLDLCIFDLDARMRGLTTRFATYRPGPGERVWVVNNVYHTGRTLRHMEALLRSQRASMPYASVVVVRNKPIEEFDVKYLFHAHAFTEKHEAEYYC